MKIKVTKKPYSEVINLAEKKHIKPMKQSAFWRTLLKVLSLSELKAVNYASEYVNMDRLSDKEPALYLMNHSSFTDLQIAAKELGNRQYHIVMTNDGMVGKERLMRCIGCIPAKKFITDMTLVKDMKYSVEKLGSSILMYPEASYSFDGTQTPLPSSLAKCIKILDIPVVMIKTKGAFLRDPLYNGLKKRKTDVSAVISYALSREEVRSMSAEEINSAVAKLFRYNHFEEQDREKIEIDEPFRAEGLERVLYKCCECMDESSMKGEGIHITCGNCKASYELTKFGKLKASKGTARYEFVPDWYEFERNEVKKEISKENYRCDIPVDIMMLVDYKSIYRVGEGTLTHSREGFRLTGSDFELDFLVSTRSSYSLYSDYFWYEIGDMVSIGDASRQYYCFPKEKIPVAKLRLAAEEMHKLIQNEKRAQ